MADIHPITDQYAATDILTAIQNLPKRLRTWPATHHELPIGQAWAKTLADQPPATTQKALQLQYTPTPHQIQLAIARLTPTDPMHPSQKKHR